MRSGSEQVAQHLAEEAADLAHQHEVAKRFDSGEPCWHIYYSASLRALVAMPLWDPGEAFLLTDTTPGDLWEQMRTAERTYASRLMSARAGRLTTVPTENSAPWTTAHRGGPNSTSTLPQQRQWLDAERVGTTQKRGLDVGHDEP